MAREKRQTKSQQKQKDLPAIALRVKQRRLLLGQSQAQIGKRCGVTSQTIFKVEKGIIEKPKFIVDLARSLQVSPDWLMDGDERYSIKIYRGKTSTEISELPTNPVLSCAIPKLSWSEAHKKFSLSQLKQKKHAQWSPLIGDGGFNTFTLEIDGTSMTSSDESQPGFYPGDIVYIDPDKELYDGAFVIAKQTGKENAIFRQYIKDNNDYWLVPLNKRYLAIPVTKETKIIGVCYEMIRSFKKPEVMPHLRKKEIERPRRNNPKK